VTSIFYKNKKVVPNLNGPFRVLLIKRGKTKRKRVVVQGTKKKERSSPFIMNTENFTGEQRGRNSGHFSVFIYKNPKKIIHAPQ